MADKMMRIAGRGVDGLAKPIKIDANGNLSVSPSKRIETISIYEGKPLLAGEAFGYEINNFQGNRIVLFVTFSNRTSTKIELDNRPPVGFSPIGATQVLHNGVHDRITAQSDVVTERMLIRFINNDTKDTTITQAIATIYY